MSGRRRRAAGRRGVLQRAPRCYDSAHEASANPRPPAPYSLARSFKHRPGPARPAASGRPTAAISPAASTRRSIRSRRRISRAEGRVASEDARRLSQHDAAGRRRVDGGLEAEVFDELNRLDPKRWRDGQPPFINNFKATPLMVGGLLYLNTPLSVGAAVDARTGATRWVYNPKSYEAGTTTMTAALEPARRRVLERRRGGERIYWGTGDGYLIAVDAKTGRPVRRLRRQRPRRSDGRPAAREARRARLPERAHLLGPVAAARRRRHRHRAGLDFVARHQEGADPRMDSRLRRAQRQDALDLQDRAPAGRVRQRDVEGRLRGRTPARSRCGRR